MSDKQDSGSHHQAESQQADYGAYQQYDQQNAYGYDYSAYYEDPSAYSKHQQGGGYDSYNQQSYGSGYGSYDTSGDGGRSQEHGGDYNAGYRDRESNRGNDRYGDSRGSYSRRDNYQDQPSRQDEGLEPGMEKSHDTIYITNLPDTVTEEKLAEVFGSIGIIKHDKKADKPKIWIYTDKTTGKPKGDATITYDDPPTADAAIEWFSNKDFMGNIIKVDKAQRKAWTGGRVGGGGGRGGGRGGYGGGGGSRGDFSGGRGPPPPRDGDWVCESCGINNFARNRTECFKCKAPRPASTMQSSGGDRGGYRGRRDHGGGDDKYSRSGNGYSRGGGDRGSNYDSRSRGGSDRRDRDEYGRHSGGGRDNDYRSNERRDRRDRPY
ncbi:hypothetical protein BGW37DRAFT_508407 [Umbelopsis sp. PMI_123]|nr:hypothetical protein BGW37DRAFT_508407 [Umbelopsis sp. PMI_123]